MKNIIKLAAVLIMAVSTSWATITVTWYVSNTGDNWLYDSTGAGWAGAPNPNWYCELVDAGTAAPDYGAIYTAFQNGTALPSGSSLITPILGNTSAMFGGVLINENISLADTYASHYVYMAFFNAATIGAATQVGFVYGNGTAWQMPGADGNIMLDVFDVGGSTSGSLIGGGTGNYSTEPVAPGYGTILPVPEPTSLALFGLGGLLVGLRRKLRKS